MTDLKIDIKEEEEEDIINDVKEINNIKNLNDDLEDLAMISRDEESGNSILEKPVEKEMVKLFLEAELGIDELFIQNLLED
jgi:ABC-type uncharacterized transport system ATPase subunit